MPSATRPHALLFDLDGTLVDTVPARIEAWLATFVEFAIPAERADVAPMIGIDGRRLARDAAAASGRTLDDATAETIDRRAGELFAALNTEPIPLPGARDLLQRLIDDGVTWAIATSSRRDQTGSSVAALGLDREPRIVDGSHVEHAKPAPDLLILAARELGVAAERCWYVGDSTWDMRAAVAAGMRPIGVLAGGAVDAAALRDAGAVEVLDALDGLRLPG